MKRDWWKVRHVLLELRAGKDFGAHSDPVTYEHLRLCNEAGFVAGIVHAGPALDHDFGIADPGRLTWQGQEAAALLEDSARLRVIHKELDGFGIAWDVLRPWLVRQLTPAGTCRLCAGTGQLDEEMVCPRCEGSG